MTRRCSECQIDTRNAAHADSCSRRGKKWKPTKSHPWKNTGGSLKEPGQRDAENAAVPYQANPLRRRY